MLASAPIVQKVDDALLWFSLITLFFLGGITITMVAFIVRYHRRRHPRAEPIHGNTLLETTWIVIPTLIAIWMFFIGYDGFRDMRNPPPGAMEIEVEGRQWFWTFRYPQHDIADGELFVPAGRPIQLHLSSPEADVLHSLYIPAFRVKEDAVPGYKTFLWFQADRPGTHQIFCAEYCGRDHSRMLSKLRVLEPADYDAWVERKLSEKFRPLTAAQAMDLEDEDWKKIDAPTLFSTYCASCHGAEGQGGLVQGARDFRKLDGWKRSPKETDIFRTLTLGIDNTQMRPFPVLPSWEKMALARFVRGFSKDPALPSATPEEFQKLVEELKLDQVRKVPREFPIDAAMQEISETAGAPK
jgi:cytochrome c oxidase subunit II